MTKVVVGTGWWGTNDPVPGIKSLTRRPSFFGLWHYFVEKYIGPEQICVVDVCAPAAPDFSLFPNTHVVRLDQNYGTPSDLKKGLVDTKYCGWTRTVFLSASYALACDADIFVYVEQDCLVFGEDFLNQAMADHDGPVWLGHKPRYGNLFVGEGLQEIGHMPQNSLIIAKSGGIQMLFNAMLDNVVSDGLHPVEGRMARNLGKGWNYLAIPYGRDRPIDFTVPAFYAQDWTEGELRCFLDRENEAGGSPPAV